MASHLHWRVRPVLLACLLAAALAASCGSGRAAQAAPPIADRDEAHAAVEPVRFSFWIGRFVFSLEIGGEAGFALAFEGLR